MKKFLVKMIVVSSPFLVILLTIIITDPYKLLFHYENYSYNTFPINRDYISTQYYIEHEQQYHYDAFIFGNSRSSAFHTTDWVKHIPEQVSPFHFDASSESLFGINRKCHYLDSAGVKLKHALILLDKETLDQVKNRDYHIFTKHYALTGQSKFDFYMVFVKSLTHKHFFKFYIDYLSGGMITKMSHKIPRDMACLPVNNDYVFSGCEEALKMGEDRYYSQYDTYFRKRSDKEEQSEAAILEEQKSQLEEIAHIFKKHQTSYQFVISPSYDQRKLHPDDVKYLKTLFGEDKIHDYSGKNEYTENIRNYYDGSHYRPIVGKLIMEEIYTSK